MSKIKVPFSRGVNFTKWFEFQFVNDIPFTKYTEQDFIDVKSLGADVVRLPISMHFFTKSETDYTIEPLLFKYLDTVCDWAEKHKIYLILDNHSFHPINPTDPNIDRILIPVWEQFAQRYKDRSEYILYEVLNEPHHIQDDLWGKIQGSVIDAIRKIDTKHTIIVGGTDFNSIAKLETIPVYKDENLIYTFHFYDPHLFTHQGASWNKPSLVPLKGLPFPYEKNRIPKTHESFKGTWVEDCLNDYETACDPKKLCATLDKPLEFAKKRGVPIFCGEFGVYIPQSKSEDRARWYKFICKEMINRDFSYTCWDYFGGFGIFKTENRGTFPQDLNVEIVNAMGFKL